MGGEAADTMAHLLHQHPHGIFRNEIPVVREPRQLSPELVSNMQGHTRPLARNGNVISLKNLPFEVIEADDHIRLILSNP